jgi:hypothetical protein
MYTHTHTHTHTHTLTHSLTHSLTHTHSLSHTLYRHEFGGEQLHFIEQSNVIRRRRRLTCRQVLKLLFHQALILKLLVYEALTLTLLVCEALILKLLVYEALSFEQKREGRRPPWQVLKLLV